jgi:hypothetical protein
LRSCSVATASFLGVFVLAHGMVATVMTLGGVAKTLMTAPRNRANDPNKQKSALTPTMHYQLSCKPPFLRTRYV